MKHNFLDIQSIKVLDPFKIEVFNNVSQKLATIFGVISAQYT